MLHLLEMLWATIQLRPYVFIFLFFYLLSALHLMGWRRTLVFTIVCWALAFISEYASTRIGIPYGIYHYIETTREQELWISNVPFMDSLSYTFLQFSAMAMSLLTLGYIRQHQPIRWPTTHKQRLQCASLSALLVMLLDVIIDPVAHQGDKWFLGKIYYYPDPGFYFDVTLSNFAGWFIVGWLSIAAFLWLQPKLPSAPAPRLRLPLGNLWGIGLYQGVALFNLAVTYYIKDYTLLFCSSCVWISTILACIWLHQRQAVA